MALYANLWRKKNSTCCYSPSSHALDFYSPSVPLPSYSPLEASERPEQPGVLIHRQHRKSSAIRPAISLNHQYRKDLYETTNSIKLLGCYCTTRHDLGVVNGHFLFLEHKLTNCRHYVRPSKIPHRHRPRRCRLSRGRPLRSPSQAQPSLREPR